MATIPEGESCASCAFMIEHAGGMKTAANPGGKQFTCQRFPPHPSLITAQGPKTPANQEGIYVGARADFPPVAPSTWCGEWAEAETGLDTPQAPAEGVSKGS